MPLLIGNCLAARFESPEGHSEWVLRDAHTGIEIDLMDEQDYWPVLSTAFAQIARVSPDHYAASLAEARELESLLDTSSWPMIHDVSMRRSDDRDGPAWEWLHSPIMAYLAWVWGATEFSKINWDISEPVVTVGQFRRYWSDLHYRASTLKLTKGGVIRHRQRQENLAQFPSEETLLASMESVVATKH